MNVSMKKVELVLPQKTINQTLEDLQNRGILEIISYDKDVDEKGLSSVEEREQSYRAKLSEIVFTLSFLERFKARDNFVKNLIASFVSLKRAVSEQDVEKITQSFTDKRVIQSAALLQEKINQLEDRKKRLLAQIDVLEKFNGTSIFAGEYSEKVCYMAGSIPAKQKGSFIGEIDKKANSCYLEFGQEDRYDFYFALFYLKTERVFYTELLRKYQVKEEGVFWAFPADEALKIARKEIQEVEIELEIQEKEARKLLVFVPELETVSDWLRWQISKEEFLHHASRTENYFVARAWVAGERLKELESALRVKNGDNFLLKELPLLESDQPPALIQNKGALSSFAMVTGLYGLPRRTELDPTPYLAPFFIVYFALALSDVGYGLLLTFFAWITKRAFKNPATDRFFNLFILGGILTAVAGFAIGTIFGMNWAEQLRIIDPVANPIGMLIFLLAAGAFQIVVGLIIGLVWLIRRGELKQAISGNGASIIFFVGTFLFLVFGNITFLWLGILGMVGLAVFFAPGTRIFARISKGLGSLYGLIGYFSDTLSYSRLLALGLATGIIASVINLIAFLLKDMIPVPGLNWLVAGLVLFFGHSANLLINVLGAFVHSARLQFIEFFPRFMEGGGRAFKPFIKQGRFVEIINA